MAILDLKKQIKIVDYAASLGFHPVKVGRWYSLKEHDSIRIDPEKNLFFRNSTGESGSIIDFVMVFTGKDLSGAIKELEAFSGTDSSVLASCLVHEENKAKGLELNLPQRDKEQKNVYAYLTKTRRIDRTVVSWMLDKGYLYQDIHKNCVFVSYKEGVPVFASIRGTNTYKRFVADVPGSDYTHGLLFTDSEKEETLIITESSIDAMSLMSLGREGNFLALSGVGKLDPVLYHLSQGDYKKVYIALDNDDAGRLAAEKIRSEILDSGLLLEKDIVVLLPKEKDWNEALLRGEE